MHERIKELFNQAGTDSSGKWMSVDNAERFAILVVDECVRALNEMPVYHKQADAARVEQDTILDCVRAVREHFGSTALK